MRHRSYAYDAPSPARGPRLLFTWPTYFAVGGVNTLALKEVFADRVSDDRRQHKELITCGATGMLREPRSYSKQYPRYSRSLTTFSYFTNTVMQRREPLPFLLASFL